MLTQTNEPLEQRAKYSIRITYMPDNKAVQSITVWSEGLDSHELGTVIEELDKEYNPLKMIVVKNP